MSLNKSPIDYLKHAGRILNRPGRSLNIVTGCLHWKGDDPICKVPCYARRMVEHGRLLGNKAYPYGFEPTFHPERIKHYKLRDKRPMLLFLNDMGDCGGDWDWCDSEMKSIKTPSFVIALRMKRFALLNPEHIILLLTKRPAWYRLATWPENVWCGFTATDNEELKERWEAYVNSTGARIKKSWISLEPWLDGNAPLDPSGQILNGTDAWLVIGGQTHPNRPVSGATFDWLRQPFSGKRFVKRNAVPLYDMMLVMPQEYPDEFRYKQKGANE